VSKPSIAVGHIRGDMVDGAWHDSMMKLLSFDSANARIVAGTGFTKGCYLDDNRNELVRDFLKLKADYLLMVDTDIEFEPHDVYQLYNEAQQNDRQIIGGMYFSFLAGRPGERGRLMPVWFSEAIPGGSLQVFHSFKPTEVIVPLAAMGMGFCLIRRDVFEKMATEMPEWAADDWTWFARDPYVWHGITKRYGEDTCFCTRAGELGIQTWGHKGVVLTHWKKTPIDFHMFRAFVELARLNGEEY
jgi:hypothetical protein